MVEAFAYVDEKGVINPRTVSATEEAAKVNAIYLLGAQVMPGCPSAMIDEYLETHAPEGALVRPVLVTLIEHS